LFPLLKITASRNFTTLLAFHVLVVHIAIIPLKLAFAFPILSSVSHARCKGTVRLFIIGDKLIWDAFKEHSIDANIIKFFDAIHSIPMLFGAFAKILGTVSRADETALKKSGCLTIADAIIVVKSRLLLSLV